MVTHWRLNVSKPSALSTVRVLIAVALWFSINVTNGFAAEKVHLAVATNFLGSAQQLKSAFEKKHDTQLVLSAASTGKLFAQIVNGAPFDVFMSADQARPRLLEEQGVIGALKRQDYAIGELVIWHPGLATSEFSLQMLRQPQITRIAIANPKTAPYGLAAQQFLQSKQLLEDVKAKLVRGENVGQAIQFVRSGNAQIGLVARSMLVAMGDDDYTPIEQKYYEPIIQQLAILSDRQEVKEFIAFLSSEAGQSIIERSGYRLP